jgi:NADH-quinone oxidoreductase subunit A
MKAIWISNICKKINKKIFRHFIKIYDHVIIVIKNSINIENINRYPTFEEKRTGWQFNFTKRNTKSIFENSIFYFSAFLWRSRYSHSDIYAPVPILDEYRFGIPKVVRPSCFHHKNVIFDSFDGLYVFSDVNDRSNTFSESTITYLVDLAHRYNNDCYNLYSSQVTSDGNWDIYLFFDSFYSSYTFFDYGFFSNVNAFNSVSSAVDVRFWNIFSVSQTEVTDYFVFFFFFIGAFTLSSIVGNVSRLFGNSTVSFDRTKISVYECGFQPFEQLDKSQLFIFYRLSVFFIIFESELIFLFPWLVNIVKYTIFNDYFFFYSPLFFIIILIYGFFYEMENKALDLLLIFLI